MLQRLADRLEASIAVMAHSLDVESEEERDQLVSVFREMSLATFERLGDESRRMGQMHERPRRRPAVRRSGTVARFPRRQPQSVVAREPFVGHANAMYYRVADGTFGRPVNFREQLDLGDRPPGGSAPPPRWQLALGKGAQQQSAAVGVKAQAGAAPLAATTHPPRAARAGTPAGRPRARASRSRRTAHDGGACA